MKKKKIIFATLFLMIGIFLIIASLFLKNNFRSDSSDLSFSNLKITSNSSLTIDVYNPTDKTIEVEKVDLYLLNEKKEIIMIKKLEINDLKPNKKKTIEYTQENAFMENPIDFYVKKHTDATNEKDNISLESKLNTLLKEKAKEVVEEKFKYETTLDLTLTAADLETKYKKDLGELKKEEYQCSFKDSFVEVSFINGNYNYTSYIDCKIFIEKEEN